MKIGAGDAMLLACEEYSLMVNYVPAQLFSVDATAELLGVSSKTIRRLMDKRELSFTKINRRVLIRFSDIEEFAKIRVVTKCDAQKIAEEILERF